MNAPTLPEVIAASNVSPRLANAPTQADVIALLSHYDTHNKTYSGEAGQFQVVNGNTREWVVMMREISTDALLNPPDDVLEEAFDAEIEIRCALRRQTTSIVEPCSLPPTS